MAFQNETEKQAFEAAPPASLDEWLDNLEAQRAALIMLLRTIDQPLVQYGRLRRETVPRRVR